MNTTTDESPVREKLGEPEGEFEKKDIKNDDENRKEINNPPVSFTEVDGVKQFVTRRK